MTLPAGKLRPLATAAAQAHQNAEKRWTEAWNSAPRQSFRSEIEVCRDVLGSGVLNTANTARACFPRGRAGYFAYAALFGWVSAAELTLDEEALRAVHERSDRHHVELFAALTAQAGAVTAQRPGPTAGRDADAPRR